METIEARLKRIIVENSALEDGGEITEDSKIEEDLLMDSLDVVTLVQDIEDEFGVKVPDEIVERWRTFGDIIASIQNKNEIL